MAGQTRGKLMIARRQWCAACNLKSCFRSDERIIQGVITLSTGSSLWQWKCLSYITVTSSDRVPFGSEDYLRNITIEISMKRASVTQHKKIPTAVATSDSRNALGCVVLILPTKAKIDKDRASHCAHRTKVARRSTAAKANKYRTASTIFRAQAHYACAPRT
jgi:hypothetical protein